MIGVSILTLAVIFCLWYLIKTVLWVIRAANMTANIPGPKPLPIIGNILLFAKVSNLQDLFKIMFSLLKKYGIAPDIIGKVWAGPNLYIFLGNPTHIKAVLSSKDALKKEPNVYDFLGILGNGVLVKNGKEWQEMRKTLDKLLTKKMVESNLDMFNEKALKFCEVLNKYADTGKVFDVRHYAVNFAVDTLSISTFGYNINELEKDQHDLGEVAESLAEKIAKYMLKFPFAIGAPYVGILIRKYTKPMWNAAKEMLQGRKENKKLGDKMDRTYFSDFLNEKAIKDKLSLDTTARLASDFLLAGFDTSAVTVSFTLLLLAMYPEHQEAVYQEQLDILGDDPEVVPTREQLSKMDYLTRILKEIMRLYGVPTIFRKLTGDVEIDKFKLPKGATVCLVLYAMHRNPTFWSHPDEFYPDHFLPEECAKRPKDCYFPFSWGPRSCAGTIHAMVANKILISTVIRKYKLETDLKFEELLFKYSFLVEVNPGYLIRIKSRI